MATDIYKAVPALNTLNVNLNDFAPDNLSLEMYKGLLKIGEEFDNTKQTAIFNQTITNLDRADQEYKNTFLSNKDVDFQNGEFRGKALAGLNDTVEYKKKLILDTKGLDGAMKQKLYNHLSEKSGTIALGVHSDVLTFETKENIDTSLKMKGDGVELLKMSAIDSDRGTYYKMIFDSVDRLSFFGENTSKLMTDTVKEITDAEAWGQGVFLQDKLFGKNLRYENILSEFESWKKTIISDEYLEKKSNEITASFIGKDSDKEKYKNAIKSNLKADYEKMIMEKTPYVMQQYETQKERELNQQRFEKQYELDSERFSYEKQRDEEHKVQMAIDKGDAITALSLANGYNTTLSDIFTGNNFSRLTGGVSLEKAIASGQTINVFSNEKLSALKNAKQIAYQNGKGIPELFNSNLKAELDSLPSNQAKEMYIRNLDAQGIMPYSISKMYLNKDPDFNRAMQSLSDIETKTGGAKNRIDITGMGNNMFKESFSKYGLDNQQQQYLADYITMLGNTNSLPKGVIIGNGGDFTRNARDAYISNSEFRNMVDSEAKLIKKYGTKSNFKVIPINPNLVNEAGNKAYQNATPAKAYIDVNGKSKGNPGSVKVLGNNNGSGKSTGGGNKVRKTTTKDGKKLNYYNSVK